MLPMDWGGARHRLLRLSLVSAAWLIPAAWLTSAIWALPACGLIVGFEARDLCEDCGTAGTSTGVTALGTNGSGGNSGGVGGSGAMGNGGAVTGGVATAGNVGGSADSGTTSEATSSGGESGTGGADSGSGGMDATGNGGSAGAGVILPETPCELDRTLLVEEEAGSYPAQLAFSKSGVASYWRLGWLDGSAVRFASLDLTASATSGEYSIPAMATLERSEPTIAASGPQVAIALGEAESKSAKLSLHYINALNPETAPVEVSAAVAGAAAPAPGGLVPVGNTDRFVVAAVTSDATGVLALFDTDHFESPLSLGSSVTSIAVAWLGQRGVTSYVADGALSIAGLEIGETGLETTPWGELTQAELASTTPERRIRAAAVGSRIAVVWVGSDGIYLTTLDPAQGLTSANAPLRVSSGSNDSYPEVAGHDDEIAVSWLDANGTLYFRRYVNLNPEQHLEVARNVGSENFGFVSDPLESVSYYGIAYNGDGLVFSRISCGE